MNDPQLGDFNFSSGDRVVATNEILEHVTSEKNGDDETNVLAAKVSSSEINEAEFLELAAYSDVPHWGDAGLPSDCDCPHWGWL